jgi:Flp pilus assembly protein TadG
MMRIGSYTSGTALSGHGRVSPLAQLVRDESGNSIIEFALGLPIMLAIYFGCLNISDAIVLQRKVVAATRALADLTTQGSAFTTVTLDNGVFQGAEMDLAPYSLTDANMYVTEIYTDNTGKSTVQWSEQDIGGTVGANTQTGYSTGSVITVWNNVAVKGTYQVVANIQYNYKPIIANQFIGSFPISTTIAMGPRASANVSFTP